MDGAMTREWGRTSADDAKATYLRALRRNGGSIRDAAMTARRKYNTIWKWRHHDEEFEHAEQIVFDDLEREGKLPAKTMVIPTAEVIVRLRAWIGCSNEKLAEVFECDVSTIKKRLERG